MKVLAIILALMLTTLAFAEAAEEETTPEAVGEETAPQAAEEGLIPADALWGCSREEVAEALPAELQEIAIGKSIVLHREDLSLGDYGLDTYYVFTFRNWRADGFTFNGLNKVVYILRDYDPQRLEEDRQGLIDAMAEQLGDPEEETEATATWDLDRCKVQVGLANFQKYNGRNGLTPGIVVTAIPELIERLETPVPQVTPKYTYVAPTPEPVVETTSSSSSSSDGDYIRDYVDDDEVYDEIESDTEEAP